MTTVVVISGPVAAGKTTLATGLVDRYGGTIVKTRETLRNLAAREGVDLRDRRGLQEFGERLDRESNGRWVTEATRSASGDGALLVVDAARITAQVEDLRETYGRRLVHVHLTSSSKEELELRYRTRPSTIDELPTYKAVTENPTEANIAELAATADAVLDTYKNTASDILIRCAAHLGLLPSLTVPLVDVLVGGEWGSEGKGNIAYYLAGEYDLLVRVGGPNAGHKVPHGGSFTHRSLPSGALANPSAHLIIGPGAVIDPRVLLTEIAEAGVEDARLTIDPQTMVISPDDIVAEEELVRSIGSTGTGVGSATARRVLGRRAEEPADLARDIPELRPYVGQTSDLLSEAFSQRKRILVEGTQGTGLSMFHGEYPWVTSRDTTVAGVLSEAGIGPRRVRRVIMVCRSYPIRVGGPSGPMGAGRELTWKEIEQRAGLKPGSIEEKGSVSGKTRRVAEFDWQLLRRSAELNSATDIALTFADYIDATNRRAFRYEQLTRPTIQFVEEIERVSGAPVSLIATDFSKRSVIDRRTWRGHIL